MDSFLFRKPIEITRHKELGMDAQQKAEELEIPDGHYHCSECKEWKHPDKFVLLDENGDKYPVCLECCENNYE